MVIIHFPSAETKEAGAMGMDGMDQEQKERVQYLCADWSTW